MNRDSEDENRSIEPGELLDDGGGIDPAAVSARKQNGVSPAVCEALRLDVAGTDRSLQMITDELLPHYHRETIRRHLCGECSHDVDTPPVERRWEPVTEKP